MNVPHSALAVRCLARALVVAASTIVAARPAAGQVSLPQFERADCPFERGDRFEGLTFECGSLVLPERRDRPSQRTVRLAVVVLRAQEPNGDPPLVVLHGGPGVGLLGTGMHAAISRWPLARDRDIVFFDQRAAGYSQPVLCAEHVEQIVAGLVRPERGFEDCAESLRALDVDRASYSTTSYAADLWDLRRALGYGRWDIYGASHGARLGLEAMRRDPEGIRSVVLARPLPPGPIVIERALHSQQTFARLFAACEADAACGAAFSPEEDFLALFEIFEQTPLLHAGTVDPTSSDSIVLDGRAFVESMQQLLESMNTIGRIPLLLHELRNGDREAAARFLLSNRGLPFGGTSARPNVSNFLVNCYDRYAPDLEARAAALASGLTPPFRSLETWGRNCTAWQDRFASEDERAQVTSDIPALILTGELDRRTPPEFGRRIASTLSRAHFIELPATLHASRPGECELAIIVEFLRDPDREPNASCVARMPGIRFATTWSDTLRQVPAITSSSAADTVENVVLNHGRPAGEMRVITRADSVAVHFMDRGDGPRQPVRYVLAPDASLRSGEVRGQSPDMEPGNIEERFEIVNGTARWHSSVDSGSTAVDRRSFYLVRSDNTYGISLSRAIFWGSRSRGFRCYRMVPRVR